LESEKVQILLHYSLRLQKQFPLTAAFLEKAENHPADYGAEKTKQKKKQTKRKERNMKLPAFPTRM